MKLLALRIDKLGRQGVIKLSHFEVLVTAPFGYSNSGLSC